MNHRGISRSTRKRALVARVLRPPPPNLFARAGRAAGHPQRLQARDRKIAQQQSALADAALEAPSGARALLGRGGSLRRPAVTKGRAGIHARCGLGGWPKPHPNFYASLAQDPFQNSGLSGKRPVLRFSFDVTSVIRNQSGTPIESCREADSLEHSTDAGRLRLFPCTDNRGSSCGDAICGVCNSPG